MTSPPPVEGVPYTHADDLAALLDERGIDDVVVVGLSMGGWVASEFTLTYPARVRGLVLVDALVREHPFPYGWNKHIGAVYRCGHEHRASTPRWRSGSTTSSSRSNGRGPTSRHACPGSSRATTGFTCCTTTPTRQWIRPRSIACRRSRVPTLVIVGEHDLPDFHAMAATLSTNIAGAVHHVLPDAGHLAHLAAPDEFVDVTASLRDARSTSATIGSASSNVAAFDARAAAVRVVLAR